MYLRLAHPGLNDELGAEPGLAEVVGAVLLVELGEGGVLGVVARGAEGLQGAN